MIIDKQIVKQAFIRKMPNGKWRVQSEKGKNLGEYDSRKDALKRLRQIEFFKHRKAEDKNAPPSYSGIMRQLNKNDDADKIHIFQKTFKDAFDKAYIDGNKKPEDTALDVAMKAIAEISYDDCLIKAASAIEMGDPAFAGKYLAEIVKFLMRRISQEKRAKSMANLRNKIYYINEYDLASKKMPASSALGQSITLLKHILLEHDPGFIRKVLNAVVSNL